MNTQITQKAVRKLTKASLLLAVLAAVQGCVTTEELYAEYDEQSCRVALVETPTGQTLVQELVSDKVMTWEPAIYFDADSAVINVVGQRHLDRDIAVLKNYRELGVSVRGFADESRISQRNRDLSKLRAENVVSYLVSSGLARSRIEDVSMGEDMPLLNWDDSEPLPVNRRVELLLIDVNGNLVPYEPVTQPALNAAQDGTNRPLNTPAIGAANDVNEQPATVLELPKSLKGALGN